MYYKFLLALLIPVGGAAADDTLCNPTLAQRADGPQIADETFAPQISDAAFAAGSGRECYSMRGTQTSIRWPADMAHSCDCCALMALWWNRCVRPSVTAVSTALTF